jgi:large subunit ribosomal protein L25
LSKPNGQSHREITMEKLQLKAEVRPESKKSLNALRRQGVVPAVMYGHGIKTVSLSVNGSEFDRVLRKAGESTIIELMVDGKVHPVLIHDIQIHFLTSRPQHVDFYQVSMTEKLKAKIVLEFVGDSIAVKNLGGVLVKALTEVEVECLPADLPHSIQVNIASLDVFGKSILVKDLVAPAKVKILTNGDETIAKVQPPRDVEAELAPVVEDVSKVEGAAENKPVEGAEGEKKSEGEKKKEPKEAKA